MKTISFDQGTQKTGYAVFDGMDLYRHGVIDLHKERDSWEREQMMRIAIKHIIKQYKPKLVVLEGVALSRGNVQTSLSLGRLQGYVLSAAWDIPADARIYYPTEWRKLLGFKQGGGIKRDVLKAQAIEMIQRTYGIDVPDDEAEAICIGLSHFQNIKENKDYGRNQKESCKKNEEGSCADSH